MGKIKNFFQSEKLKAVCGKVFTKKKIRAFIALLVLLIALRVGYIFGFQVRGTVLKVGTNTIEVTNFWGTSTVNTGDYPLDSSKIYAGEKIVITKNLSGDIISIRLGDGRNGRDNFGNKDQFGGERNVGLNGTQQDQQGQKGMMAQGQNQTQGGQFRGGRGMRGQNGQNFTPAQGLPNGNGTAGPAQNNNQAPGAGNQQ